jgi:hypothetical protein
MISPELRRVFTGTTQTQEHMKFRLLLYFFFACTFKSISQPSGKIDTLEFSRAEAYSKNFIRANQLLTAYNKDNNDANGLWLQAQVLYWMKDYKSSLTLFEKATLRYPTSHPIKLDYGRTLFQLGEVSKAEEKLKQYLLFDEKNAEANLFLVYIDNWNGKTREAKTRAEKLLSWYPDYQPAKDILKDINFQTSPNITTGIGVIADDQPLNGTNYFAQVAWYKSAYVSPTITLNLNRFQLPDSSFKNELAEVSNKVMFGKAGITLTFGAGIFKSGPGLNQLTGKLKVSKKVSPAFSLIAGTERLPYQYTTTGIQKSLMYQLTTAAVVFNTSDKWLGQAGYQLQSFKDNNKISTAYGWLLSPLVHNKFFKIKGGYSFSFANSQLNSFTSAKPLPSISSAGNLGYPVAGIYDPYFSPQNQAVHFLLASVQFTLAKGISFSSRGSYGFHATMDNPYLFLATTTSNKYYLQKGYYKETYTPLELYNSIQLQVAHNFIISANYEFSSLLFYTRNQGNIQLKYTFSNVKK